VLSYFICLCFFCGNAQNIDTVYYSNKAVLMITSSLSYRDTVYAIYNQQVKNLINRNYIEHTFFDDKFKKKRSIIIKEKILIEDYCVLESDTVYNYFHFDEDFKTRKQQFYNYLEQNVVYPKNALKKGIQTKVKISLIIDSNGAITQVFPLTKNEWGFEESLIRTMKEKKQFGFVLYKNKPVKLYLEIPFAFKIAKR